MSYVRSFFVVSRFRRNHFKKCIAKKRNQKIWKVFPEETSRLEPYTMRSLQGLRVILSRAFSTEQSAPVIAAKHPFKVELKAGKRYPWCSCGHSKKQPFCDGSHLKAALGLAPVRFTPTEDKEAWLCGCKQTKKPPYCDGTHKQSSVQNCTLEQ